MPVTVRVHSDKGISRVTAETIGDLQQQLAQRYSVPPEQQVLGLAPKPTVNQFTNPDATLESLGLQNGAAVHVVFLAQASLPEAAQGGIKRYIPTGEGSGGASSSVAGPSSSSGAASSSTSMDIQQMIDAHERSILRLRPQFTENRKCAFLAIDRQCLRNFHEYVHRSAYTVPRMGYLFGYENEFDAVEAHVIWEPPQVVDNGQVVELEGELDKALELARLLNMTCIGWIFTKTTPHDTAQPLSAHDVYRSARLQARFGPKFCTLLGYITHEGAKTVMGFEVFQMSEQCLQVLDEIQPDPSGPLFVYRGTPKKKFEYPTEFRNQEIMSGSAEELHDTADPSLFLVPLPMVSGKGILVVNFPVENRPDIPQEHAHFPELLKKFESYPLTQRLADFHVLYWLYNIFGPAEMEGVCQSVLHHDPSLMQATKDLLMAMAE